MGSAVSTLLLGGSGFMFSLELSSHVVVSATAVEQLVTFNDSEQPV